MFGNFDFRALNDPSFKEDSVREELVAPILRRLGYSAIGRARVVRSKNLEHPFVRIGTKKYPVSIIPDYTLLFDDCPILVIDAKRPGESVTNPVHIEQAYSYAIHREVRCKTFAICNGHFLNVWDVESVESLAILRIETADEDWEEFERFLSPRYLLMPQLRDFSPDLGLALSALGIPSGARVAWPGVALQYLGRVSDALYTVSASFDVEGKHHLANFDLTPNFVDGILACLPETVRLATLGAMARSPFQVSLDMVVIVDLNAILGERTQGLHDSFAPFLVRGISNARVSYPPDNRAKDTPGHIFRLADVYEAYVRSAATPD